ncbi:aspartyl protease family protein At5g10770-like [Euphorbia lathyris]|uniref:aspartyl protease family protein At5g10770-like n=1 Tax=Euphorbia lathyris TaxID=212925 RepID=UPI003313D60F
MGSIWFLGFFMVLATSSFAEFLEGNQSSIQLNLYHVRGRSSSLSPNSSLSLFDVLSRDEHRAKSLSRMMQGKKSVKGAPASHHHKSKSGHLLEPHLAGVPLNSGLSIGSGNYYVKLGLGSPPKYYAMILDTGSSLSWLQCNPCVIYCHNQVGPLFEPSASSSYRSLSCGTPECSSLKSATLNDPACTASGRCVYTASYGDSSYSMGYLSQDLLTLAPSQTLPRFTYGCGQDNEGLFGRAAGIVGLARDKLSMLAQLSTRYGYAFSYCLPTATSSSSAGGFLSIGKISPSAYKFTPMRTDSQNPSLYFLRFSAITVAGRPLRLSAAGYQVPTIIDSGTVITRLPSAMYTALRQAFVEIMSKKYAQAPAYSILDTCFKGSPKSMSTAPVIQLVFEGGASLSVGAANSLIEADKGVTCLAFASSNQIAIIGNHQQQTYNIAYDVSASRIGFAPGGCH